MKLQIPVINKKKNTSKIHHLPNEYQEKQLSMILNIPVIYLTL